MFKRIECMRNGNFTNELEMAEDIFAVTVYIDGKAWHTEFFNTVKSASAIVLAWEKTLKFGYHAKFSVPYVF